MSLGSVKRRTVILDDESSDEGSSGESSASSARTLATDSVRVGPLHRDEEVRSYAPSSSDDTVLESFSTIAPVHAGMPEAETSLLSNLSRGGASGIRFRFQKRD